MISKIKFHKVLLKKKFPLAISRGVRGDSYNLFLSYEKDGLTGWGEAAPGKNEKAETVEEIEDQLVAFLEQGIESKTTEELNQILPLILLGIATPVTVPANLTLVVITESFIA